MRSLRSVGSLVPEARARTRRSVVPFPIRLRVAQLRAIAVRRRVVGRAAVGLVLGVLALAVVREVRAARVARAQWGDTVEVVVVTDAAPIGSALGELRTERRFLPVALVPDDALMELPTADDHLVVPLRAGEPLTARDVASTRREARSLPEGTRAIGVPVDAATPDVGVGDRVDVILLADPFEPGTVSSVVRPPSVVLEATDETITLAVPEPRVAELLAARADGRVSLAVR